TMEVISLPASSLPRISNSSHNSGAGGAGTVRTTASLHSSSYTTSISSEIERPSSVVTSTVYVPASTFSRSKLMESVFVAATTSPSASFTTMEVISLPASSSARISNASHNSGAGTVRTTASLHSSSYTTSISSEIERPSSVVTSTVYVPASTFSRSKMMESV